MFEPVIIARIKSGFPDKFGVPRQSGMIEGIVSEVVFEGRFNNPDAVRGIDEFSHIWLVWYFDKSAEKEVSLTVRPPKLGGNKRIGVFASRSPFRPNPIGLSLVKLLSVDFTNGKLRLIVEGADLVDGTPILDIKPYLPYTECVMSATGSFTENTSKVRLYVDFPHILLNKIERDKQEIITELLSLDPRPGYQSDEERVYGVNYYGYNVKFKIDGQTLTVTDVEKA